MMDTEDTKEYKNGWMETYQYLMEVICWVYTRIHKQEIEGRK